MEKIEFYTDLGIDRAGNFLFYTRPEDKEKLMKGHKWDKVHVTLSPVKDPEHSRRVEDLATKPTEEPGTYQEMIDDLIYLRECCGNYWRPKIQPIIDLLVKKEEK